MQDHFQRGARRSVGQEVFDGVAVQHIDDGLDAFRDDDESSDEETSSESSSDEESSSEAGRGFPGVQKLLGPSVGTSRVSAFAGLRPRKRTKVQE